MIEDLKNRILARSQELSVKVREYEDSLLTNRTQLNSYISNLNRLKENLESQQRPDFDQLIALQEVKLAQAEQQKAVFEVLITSTEPKLEVLNQQLLDLTNEKAKISNEELAAYTTSHTNLEANKSLQEFNITNVKKEIAKLKSIVDYCPTCGQHIPHVHKPDTSALEAQLIQCQESLEVTKLDIKKCENQHKEYRNQIEDAFKADFEALNKTITEEKAILQKARIDLATYISTLENERASYNKLIYDKQNWDGYIKRQQDEISRLEAEIARLTNLISITSLAKEDYDQRISIIKKMDQLTKRDFRGYLLTNIINYIDNKAKDYCATVFGTRELILEINGNALDITYCGKAFDGLSGGEKQRVDLILQLAIRDLLNSYLGLSANILVLDEITDFLDKKSCQAVMQLLEKELQTIESVFIISHHAEELDIPVDSEIKVVKNEHGISELC